MSFYYFFRMLGDLAVIYAAANSFLSFLECNVSSLLPLFILALCGTVGFFLYTKAPQLRYLALLPMPLVFFIGQTNLVTKIVLAVSVVYAGVCIILPNFQLDHEERRSFFVIGCGLLAASILPRSFFIPLGEPGTLFVPYVIIFAASTLLLTQALRHNENILLQTRFRLMCGGCLGLLIVLTAFLSSPTFTSFLVDLAGLFYKLIIGSVILVVSAVLWVVVWVLTHILPSLPTPHGITIEPSEFIEGVVYQRDPLLTESVGLSPTTYMVIQAIVGVVAIVLLVWFFVKMLKKHKDNRFSRSTSISRQKISQSRFPEDDISYGPNAPKDPRKAVRYYYHKFLESCRESGIVISKDQTSEMIGKEAKRGFNFNAFSSIDSIRRIYIRARYSPHEVSDEDVEQIKSDCDCVAQNIVAIVDTPIPNQENRAE